MKDSKFKDLAKKERANQDSATQRERRSLTYLEIGSLASWISQRLSFAQLQEVWTNGRQIVLSFYNRQEFFLLIDSQLSHPKMGVFCERPTVEKKNKPLTLFLNSHAKNLRLEKVETQWQWGRVLKLHLTGGPKKVEIEIILIPRAFNVLVEVRENSDSKASSFGKEAILTKKISWDKPRELPPSIANPGRTEFPEVDWLQFSKELFFPEPDQSRISDQSPLEVDPSLPRQANSPEGPSESPQVQKKKKILEKLQINLSELSQDAKSESWLQLGEALKTVRELKELPDDLKTKVDFKISLKQNRERAFKNYKQIEEKKERVLGRIQELENELAREIAGSSKTPEERVFSRKGPAAGSPSKDLLDKAKAQARKLEISEQVFAYIGKSGKDNLEILRKAQPWDLWVHLKDYPGAHAIISRPRNFEIQQATIEKVARWVIKESFNNKKVSFAEIFEVLVVETRFVKPIKGDKLGRVTYQNPQVFRIRLNP